MFEKQLKYCLVFRESHNVTFIGSTIVKQITLKIKFLISGGFKWDKMGWIYVQNWFITVLKQWNRCFHRFP